MADRIPSDQFAEILRVVRETVREEMRAEFDGRRAISVVPMLAQREQKAIDAARASGALGPDAIIWVDGEPN